MNAQWRPAIVSMLVLTVLTGIAYPFFVTGAARIFFPHKADGSLVYQQGRPIGSSLIGQPFDDPKYFWGRPSATVPVGFNGASSSGSNLGPLNPALLEAVQARVRALRALDPENTEPVPVDLVTASASGLDPHISIAAAEYQVGRVARARGIPEAEVRELVRHHEQGRLWGLIGEPVVNVLQLNLALDTLGRK